MERLGSGIQPALRAICLHAVHVFSLCSRVAEFATSERYTHTPSVLQGITDNNKWTLALSIFYVGYCAYTQCSLRISVANRESSPCRIGILEMPANGMLILFTSPRDDERSQNADILAHVVLQRYIGANRLFVFLALHLSEKTTEPVPASSCRYHGGASRHSRSSTPKATQVSSS